MRIAITSEENNGLESMVCQHFGRSPYFVLVDIEENKIARVETIENPFSQKHNPGDVPAFVAEFGVNSLVSGGMGKRAIGFFEQYGITVATGALGTVAQSLEKYLQGNFPTAEPCSDSVEHGANGHHHH
ncbi:MAG: NifB/NifX family molybdenum-iron cluster-binding protein [Anaerolineae bacterium]|nr:NifB/NifX family molybdenum-iron cluster-binding protein [Anaerolineae bacterium]MBL6966149.1 NifB/NifX family molybdenum-iron cluster-binding protein [Anaerolineales bacterium]